MKLTLVMITLALLVGCGPCPTASVPENEALNLDYSTLIVLDMPFEGIDCLFWYPISQEDLADRECGGEGWSHFPRRYQPCEGTDFYYQTDADGKVVICADGPVCDFSQQLMFDMYAYAAGTNSIPSEG